MDAILVVYRCPDGTYEGISTLGRHGLTWQTGMVPRGEVPPVAELVVQLPYRD